MEVFGWQQKQAKNGVDRGRTLAFERLEERQMLAFSHPGILSTQADFDRMTTQLAASAQPWVSGYNALTADGYSQAGWNPRPLATVVRGGTGENFNQMVIDMQRAFQTAVRWKVGGNTLYADQAVAILNAWSNTHTVLTGNADRFLASGLYGFGWAAAAEIMRGYSGWAPADVTKFQNYLVNIYYPLQHQFLTNHNDAAITNYWANWDLANLEGMMAIGIFADRQDLYDEAIAYLYDGGGNGALDKMAYYRHAGNLMQWQESGRDQGHTTLGMALMGHINQMAWNQGLDLFAYNNNQFLAAAEYVAKYNLGYDVPYETYNWGTGQSGTWSTQPGVSPAGRGHGRLAYELIEGHYVERLGIEAKYTSQRVAGIGVEGRGSGDEFGFGTLLYTQIASAAPQAPGGLTAVEQGANTIRLDWFGGDNVATYNVYRATSSSGPFALIASDITDLLTYTDRDLPPGDYFYRVTGSAEATETAASNTVSAAARSRLTGHLSFNEASGFTASDATGNGTAGTLNGGATWVAGKSGNAVSLNGSNGYVSFPTSPVNGYSDFTISTWVNLNTTQTWARIFDFGDTDGRWMFLSPRNGGGVIEFATSTNYGYNKQFVTGTVALPTNQWVHVAVTLADRVATIYVNGVAVGANANMDFPPSEIWNTKNNWIGRSQFAADPYLNGRVDDFRVSRGSLSAGEMYQLATGFAPPAVPAAPATFTATAVVGNRIDLTWSAVPSAATYSIYRASVSGGPFQAIKTLHNTTTYSDTGLAANLAAGTPYFYKVVGVNNGGEGAGAFANATALPPLPSAPTALAAQSNTPTSIQLTWTAGTNAASYTIQRALSAAGPFATIATGVTANSYTNTGLASGTNYYYVVTAVNAAGTSGLSNQANDTPSDRHARLTFEDAPGTLAADITGNGWNGTLVNGPLFVTGKIGAGVDLDGANDHLTLPTGVVNGLTSATISTWVNLDAHATWQRIFDFGTGTTNYMFLTTQYTATAPNAGKLRFAIRTPSVGEQLIGSSVALPIGSWAHVAVVLAGSVGTLYLNGVQVGQNTAMTLTPSSLGATTLNYLGRSQFNDPYFNGKLDDFRINNRALSAAEVQALASVPALLGDYNRDNAVDAADYSVWRDALGSTTLPYATADGTGDGVINQEDYAVWNAAFGRTLAATPVAVATAAVSRDEALAIVLAEYPEVRPARRANGRVSEVTRSFSTRQRDLALLDTQRDTSSKPFAELHGDERRDWNLEERASSQARGVHAPSAAKRLLGPAFTPG